MSERAEVSSIQAIADFRTALILYIAKVRPLLDDCSDEIFRTREWMQVTQRLKWEQQIQARTRLLTDAQQALFSAQLSKLRPPSSAELAEVQKAKRALGAAEEKLRTTKRVSSTFEKEALPRMRQIESLRAFVATDLQEAVQLLERIITSLDAYAAIPAPPNTGEAVA